MYPGTIVNWHDNSNIDTSTIADTSSAPLFLTASSFDKGPEDMRRVIGADFYNLYGDKIYFNRHGQAGIQAKNIIDNGGALLVKRLVADDATLSNIIFCANLTTDTTQKTNADGDPLYKDADGNETTEVTDEMVMETSVVIKWTAVSVENAKTYDDIIEMGSELYDPENGVYPLIMVCDNGRGDTGKAVKFEINKELSISLGKAFYNVSSFEGTTRVEYITGTIGSCVYQSVNYHLNEFSMDQLRFYIDNDILDTLNNTIADALGLDVSEVALYDIIGGTTYKGVSIDGLSVDSDSIDLAADYGVELENGDDGSFASPPVGTDEWEQALINFFDGSFTDEIYDVDEYKVAFVVDANYPYAVKEAIAELVTFREDCFFFRDTRLDVTSYATALDAIGNFETNNKFIGNYITWYQIYDPETARRIKVTMMYDMAACLVNRYENGIYNPTAGIVNGFILASPIEGTVNYTPRITPSVNQKQLLDDARINYAMFQSGQCIVQSLYTSQEAYTQLSYINNVLAIQNVIRVIRDTCPKERYTFVTGNDFSSYSAAVNRVLKNMTEGFSEIYFDYTQNSALADQKIFYASIYFAFNNWAQTEIFDIFAIDTESIIVEE